MSLYIFKLWGKRYYTYTTPSSHKHFNWTAHCYKMTCSLYPDNRWDGEPLVKFEYSTSLKDMISIYLFFALRNMSSLFSLFYGKMRKLTSSSLLLLWRKLFVKSKETFRLFVNVSSLLIFRWVSTLIDIEWVIEMEEMKCDIWNKSEEKNCWKVNRRLEWQASPQEET